VQLPLPIGQLGSVEEGPGADGGGDSEQQGGRQVEPQEATARKWDKHLKVAICQRSGKSSCAAISATMVSMTLPTDPNHPFNRVRWSHVTRSLSTKP
jgi:hypothetical protein